MLPLILYFSFALGVSFLCSLLEAVILSITPAYASALHQDHPKAAQHLNKLKDNIDRPLSAILTLNTVAHTIGAAGVGAEVLDLWGSTYVAIASVVLTLLILIFSEIIPKTLGAAYAKQLAPASAYIIRSLIVILYPCVLALEAISNLLAKGGKRAKISREEMLATARIGQSQGTLQIREFRVIQNILHLKNIRVKDILTPRSVLLAFRKDRSLAEVVRRHSPIRFSRIPIYDKNPDDIIGFVHRYKVLQAFSQGKGLDKLESLASPIHAIPDTKSVSSTLDEFIKRREQIFLVVDEYGGTAGIITLEDAIETLLGVEIVDEFDTVEDMRKFALAQWETRKNKRKL